MLAIAAMAAPPAAGQVEIEVSPDPGRVPAVHRIPMYDENNTVIRPGDQPARPFSSRHTCGKCHDYSTVSRGWHFNFSDANAPPGRPGQAWLLADMSTGTQIPLSGRGWKGTWRPQDLGISAWRLMKTFGRHLPGGDLGERYPKDQLDPASRWMLSGDLEVNCLGCHNASRAHDQNLWSEHISGRENFRWAATAASGLGYVDGFTNLLPSDYDPAAGTQPDFPAWIPRVEYPRGLFNAKNEVFFDVDCKDSARRCYYCHTNHPAGKDEWRLDEDVHLAKGLRCTDCHRNGLDHRISRNYEGEPGVSPSRTCRGCHMGTDDAADPDEQKGGHLAAPRPEHAGFPQTHFDKLACTACHSGPWPQPLTQRVQTARAHGLGYHAMAYDPDAAPYIQEPVFVKQACDGKIAPHRMVFPAFWGRLKDGQIQPILPEVVADATGYLLKTRPGVKPKPPTVETIAQALKLLAADAAAGEAVYVSAGKLHRLDASGQLAASDHEAAKPYSWPIAHDVRPAVQSLGYGGAAGCEHCHSSDSSFLFGAVAAMGPSAADQDATVEMCEMSGEDPIYHTLFALTFVFRPWLKVVGFLAAAVIALVLVGYGVGSVLRGLGWRAGE